MLVTEEIFQAFLKCETKSHLISLGAVGDQREFTDWQDRQVVEYKRKCLVQLRAKYQEDESLICAEILSDFSKAKFCLALDCLLQVEGLQSHIHALERFVPSDQKKHNAYFPIRFVPREKITSHDKLLLAFDALVLSAASGHQPAFGKIIHGNEQKALKVQLPDLMETAKAIVGKISAQQASTSPPPLILNKHCAECEFKTRCRQIAVEKDELSLLSGLNEKERKKQHSKGIFTVTQLSYTYRPRRRPKRLAAKPDNYSPALRALAIRERKIHIAGSPKLNLTGTPVCLDVEGVPDRDFYYLIGLRIKSGDAYVQHSFWANDASEEKVMWAAFLQALAQVENPQLVHYGSYETTFLKQMKERYSRSVESAAVVDQLVKGSVNVLSVIYARIYFPTYSNSLKEIAPYLSFHWSESDASGLTSLIWRSEWECTEDASLKQKLVTYNAEDCEALEKVAVAVAQLCQSNIESVGPANNAIVHTDLMKRGNPYHLGKFVSSLPELNYINQAAYWNYQREKIYVKSNLRLKRTLKKTIKANPKPLRINKIIESPSPDFCPRCNSPHISKYGKFSKTVQDIKFSKTGLKRWITEYRYNRYICVKCESTFFPPERPMAKIGSELADFIVYQIIDLQIPQLMVGKVLASLFDIQIDRSTLNRQKSEKAQFYTGTYEAILKKMTKGNLIHADETKASVEGRDGYVWVLTSLEQVIYFFTETREGETLKILLQGFKGVLVSDFYSAYDAIECPQQKCLIHLIRDLNNDLHKQPFNEELKELVQEVALLLKPMIETVDRFGLKAYFLQKHKLFVERFYKLLSRQNYQSEIAISYKKRFDKNRDKLFTFLDYDGVPWNNNNAEHAIKAFAALRKVIRGSSTVKGIRDYLILLSIRETCKYKEVSFLHFLRSGEKDIDTFIKMGSRVSKRASHPK